MKLLSNKSNRKILHIVPDNKFIDETRVPFEKVHPGENEYLHIGIKKEYEYIKNSTEIKQISRRAIFSKEFRAYLKQFRAIVFHSYSGFYYFCIALSAPKDIKILWLSWGFDYYHLVCKTEDLLKPETLRLYKLSKQHLSNNKKNDKKLITRIGHHLKHLATIIIRKKSYQRIDLYSGIKEELNYLKKIKPWIRAKHLPLFYGYAFSIPAIYPVSDRKNILVGNSATYTNNHMEIFNIISKYDVADRTIICPVNYGDIEYAKQVEELGKGMFGVNFFPLKKFVGKNDYAKIISSCSLVFMNHLRQQAFGTINMAIMYGAKVFLDPKNPFYKLYKESGIKIYDITKIDEYSFERLSPEQTQRNIEIFKKSFSNELIHKTTLEAVKELLSEKLDS